MNMGIESDVISLEEKGQSLTEVEKEEGTTVEEMIGLKETRGEEAAAEHEGTTEAQ